MKGASPDLSAATYQIHDETHTIGNALRWMIMKKCALPAPHPSENVIQVRIQMYDGLSSLSALITALGDLDAVCTTIEDAYVADLHKGEFERWDEPS
ncbi:RBP11-like subunits of RNA polymerase [Mycena pura]|uniref:RBP11-like subunits of RNA polymerase n=1 Tax=Mycena pura TaxID=153505 RepID=A0AAD6V7N3_9AGAR|nr:RBP11-like subunits of RNA polymerase [Mycena pura]